MPKTSWFRLKEKAFLIIVLLCSPTHFSCLLVVTPDKWSPWLYPISSKAKVGGRIVTIKQEGSRLQEGEAGVGGPLPYNQPNSNWCRTAIGGATEMVGTKLGLYSSCQIDDELERIQASLCTLTGRPRTSLRVLPSLTIKAAQMDFDATVKTLPVTITGNFWAKKRNNVVLD